MVWPLGILIRASAEPADVDDAEIDMLLQALAPGRRHQPVLVSAVAGLGGIGKTEPALRTAAEPGLHRFVLGRSGLGCFVRVI
ncbi:hypothetical protein ACIOJD_13265 [Streptomyces sp. NPDC088116]|uniref:hypothetical protein n=1 Tax=Streptomyces sp. NPDC088116 TaxID=3365825 RepID=UPI0037FF6222